MKKVYLILFTVLVAFFTCSVIQAQNEIKNMDIIDADIRDVLRSFGELGGYNVLMDKSVQGSVSLKFTSSLSVKDAIQMVAQTYGYSFVWANTSTIIIGNKDTFKDFGVMTTKVYSLQFATVEQTMDALKVVIPVERIGKDVRSNALAIKANSLEHENIEEVIKRLDREVPQVNIDLRVEELSMDDSRSLGFTPDIAGGYDGAHWFITPTTALNALETSKKSKLLANPNISTTDNQEGQILIGEKYPIITKTVDDSNKTTYTANYIDIGTKLSITPRINSDNVVTVTVKAEISNINGSVKVKDPTTGSENEFPIIDTRQTSSVVRLKHGETFVLSGLSNMQNTDETTGTPFLSKIPVLGWLFKTKDVKPSSREICIFLTPHIVRTQKINDDNKAETESAVNKEDIKKEDASTKTQEVIATPASTNSANDSQNTVTATSNSETTQSQLTDVKTNAEDTTVTPVVIEDTNVKPEDAPAPPPEPIQIVIDDKTSSTPVTTTPKTDNSNTTRTVTSDATQNREFQYTVKKEDNLYQISKRFGVTQDMIISRNQLVSKDTIKVGQTIVIPVPADHLYQIKPKETLWRIAKRYGTTVDVLMEINGMTDASQIKSGQTIILPTAVDKVANADY